MSKNIVWENPKDELLDTPLDSKPVITEIEDIIDTDDTVSEEKNYIMRNGKKYYLTKLVATAKTFRGNIETKIIKIKNIAKILFFIIISFLVIE